MHEKRFSFLFAAVMLAMFVPLLPAMEGIQEASAEEDPMEDVSLQAVTQTSSVLKKGYLDVGTWAEIPEVKDTDVITADVLEEQTVQTIPLAPRPHIDSIDSEKTYGIAAATNSPSPPSPYEAVEIARSVDNINANPGQAFTYWVDFKNVGTATWHNSGEHFIALNVTDPSGRTSAFQHPYWRQSYRPAIMDTETVEPGEIGRFIFALQVPATTGIYKESFNLVAENLTWITGGHTTINIGVGVRATRAPHWRAQEVERSYGGTLHLDPGKGYTFWIDFLNTGSVPWFNDGEHFVALNVTSPIGRQSDFEHSYWSEYYRPGKLLQEYVRPGEIGRFMFALQPPMDEGTYEESFQLVSENLTWIPGGSFTVPIQVGDPLEVEPIVQLTGEPTIRVGLTSTDEEIVVTANGTYAVWNGTKNLLTTKQADQETSIISHSDGTYTIDGTLRATRAPRMIPSSEDVIMEVVSFENPPAWNSELNDNLFRGTIEIKYVEETATVWVINELPLESYLYGMAESGNGSPAEYLKALAIAERSYVLWHYLNGGKHKTEDFTVNSTTDQVYRGYGFESRSVDPLAAVIATTGQVVTFADAVSEANEYGVVFTPYSSGTDGRTRSWSEVWVGDYDWLVSVNDPHGIIPNALTLSGNHMVGMSATGALGFAEEEGKTFEWILNYYYTGISIDTLY
ncbi:SpoIID/LytB domain-containing protein [Patescibacteria group bacterium]